MLAAAGPARPVAPALRLIQRQRVDYIYPILIRLAFIVQMWDGPPFPM